MLIFALAIITLVVWLLVRRKRPVPPFVRAAALGS